MDTVGHVSRVPQHHGAASVSRQGPSGETRLWTRCDTSARSLSIMAPRASVDRDRQGRHGCGHGGTRQQGPSASWRHERQQTGTVRGDRAVNTVGHVSRVPQHHGAASVSRQGPSGKTRLWTRWDTSVESLSNQLNCITFFLSTIVSIKQTHP